MENKIFEVVVPTEKKIRVKGRQAHRRGREDLPGLHPRAHDRGRGFVVRRAQHAARDRLRRFGTTPVPMEESEVATLMKRMGAEAPKHRIDLMKDDPVVIADGPFKDLEGKVGEIDEERGKVKVLVSMFGRETPVELDFLQIRKL
jgi:transcriptional antiterminator NusG